MTSSNPPLNVTIRNNTGEETPLDPSWFPISYLVIGIIGTMANLFACIVLLKQVHKKPLTKRYSLNLSVGNTLYSIAAISLYAAWPGTANLTQGICTFLITVYLISYYLCILSMILSATERICAIRFPLYFRKMTTARNICVQITTVWCLAFLLAVYPAIDYRLMAIATELGPLQVCDMAHREELRVYNLITDLLVPMLVFIGLTVWAIIALNKRSTVAAVGVTKRRAGNSASLKKSKLYLTFLTVMISLCYGPYFIFCVLDLVMATFKDETVYGYIRLVCIFLTFSHTLLNPIMQWTCDKCFRRDAIRTFCCREPMNTDVSRETGGPITVS